MPNESTNQTVIEQIAALRGYLQGEHDDLDTDIKVMEAEPALDDDDKQAELMEILDEMVNDREEVSEFLESLDAIHRYFKRQKGER